MGRRQKDRAIAAPRITSPGHTYARPPIAGAADWGRMDAYEGGSAPSATSAEMSESVAIARNDAGMVIAGADPSWLDDASIGNGGRTGCEPEGGSATGASVVEVTAVDVGPGADVVGFVGSGGPSVDDGGTTVVVVGGAGGDVVVVVVGGGTVVVGGGVVVDDVVVVDVVVVDVGGVVDVVVVGSGKSAEICTLSKYTRPPCPGVDSTRNRIAVFDEIHVERPIEAEFVDTSLVSRA